ncbi:AAA family ATPase [Pedobacter gandavensis]|uniref:AAA family ATPase n=1 Tax=Pedobacter gandavensis TaxID=2679963 RepID=A0ABR6ERX2_9SPHI|nr:AAA family ATPase [Pedobacter gandavensis]MBB2148010.1 AAA family ATPase [Pedobacter gandavensis]
MDFKPYLQEIGLREGSIKSFDHYPFNIPAIKNMPTIKFHADVTFIVGENGSGKSTFIESLAQYLGISRAGGSNQSQVEERPDLSLSDHFKGTRGHRRPSDYFFLRAESLFNVATYLDETYLDREKLAENYGVNSLHECSHGESFLAIMANRLGGNGLYLFDEPEAALSPTRQLTALSLIDNLVNMNSQFIIATHSPILLSYPNAKIYQFDEIGISEVSYEDTEQFRVTKSFLNNYKSMIHNLLRK